MRLYEIFTILNEETPKQIGEYYGDELLRIWNERNNDQPQNSVDSIIKLFIPLYPHG